MVTTASGLMCNFCLCRKVRHKSSARVQEVQIIYTSCKSPEFFGLLVCSEEDCLIHIKSMMVANCHDRYYRVLVTEFVWEEVVIRFFIGVRNLQKQLFGIFAEKGSLWSQSLPGTSPVQEDEQGSNGDQLENDNRLAIILQHFHSGFNRAAELSVQGLATFSRVDSQHEWMVDVNAKEMESS